MAQYERIQRSDGETTVVAAPISPWGTLRRLVALIFGIVQTLIVLRIVLLLFGANQTNEIVKAILNVTSVLVDPFRGIFALDSITSKTGSVLDVAAIVALVAWTLIEALVIAILRLGDRRLDAAT